MSTDYGYANARIRAMKSLLLKEDFYSQLLRAGSFDNVVTALRQTPYARDLDEVMIKENGLKGFDEALRRNIMKAFAKLARIMEDDGIRLTNLLLGRWDIANIKAILRGKNLGVSSDNILESLIPAGEIDEATLIELVNAHSVRDCVDVMATLHISFAVPLTGAFPQYALKRNMSVLELALDKFFYERAVRELKRPNLSTQLVREMLIREIDTTNIMMVLRVVKDEIDRREAAAFFIPGGKELSVKRLNEIANKRMVEDVVQALSGTSYYKLLSDKMPSYFETNSLTGLERGLEEAAVRRGIKMFLADPLSIAGAIGYIWAKHNEIVNLRIIARGKQVGMPEARIQEALIIA